MSNDKLAIHGGPKVVNKKFPWPIFDESDVEAVAAIARSGEWANPDCKGFVETFEKEFAAYVGSRYAVSCANGSVALRLALIAAALLCQSCTTIHPDWVNLPDFSDRDKASIVELVGNLGLQNPRTVTVRRRLPSSDRYYIVGSEIQVNGLRRTWREVYLCRVGEGYCPADDPRRVGSWSILREGEAQERWRISDGDWFVDVALGSAISYAEAETIVRAIHRDELVSTLEYTGRNPTFSASELTSIRTVDPLAGEFQVSVNGSRFYSLEVRLNGSEVELYSVIMLQP